MTPTPSGQGCACTGLALYLLKNATDFDYYDPQRIYTNEDLAFFGATIMRSLVAYKYAPDTAEATTLVPDMATDTGRANTDATSWTFTLRDGLTWQDGSPVRCADVAYGVSRTFATDTITGGPTYAIRYLNIPRNDDGSSQYPGPYTATPEQQALFDAAVVCDGSDITFNLAATVPDFNFTTTLGFGAVPNPVDHPGVDTAENYVGPAVWSDGPYKIDVYNPTEGGSLELVRNDAWSAASDSYRGAYPDKWVVEFGLDLATIDRRLMDSTGNDAFAVSYGPLQPDILTTVFSDAHTPNSQFADRAFSDYDPYVRYYWINTKKVPNRDVRAAIAAALDREQIRLNAGGDFFGDFADGVIKPNIGQDYAPTGLWNGALGQPIPDGGDPDYARQLIAQSGETAPKLTWNYFARPTADRNAAIVEQSLERAGFRVKVNPIYPRHCYSTAHCYDDLYDGDLGSSGWAGDRPNASTVIPSIFTDEVDWNYSEVDDTSGIPDWSARINDARTTLDRASQAAKWQELNKEAVEQVWVVPMFFTRSQTIAGVAIRGAYRWPVYSSWPYAQLYAEPPG